MMAEDEIPSRGDYADDLMRLFMGHLGYWMSNNLADAIEEEIDGLKLPDEKCFVEGCNNMMSAFESRLKQGMCDKCSSEVIEDMREEGGMGDAMKDKGYDEGALKEEGMGEAR